jgi:hypothetical protein
MEAIPEAWNVTHEDAPPHILNWNKKDILDQFQNIKVILQKYGIGAQDGQVAISKEGKVFLIDLDFATQLSAFQMLRNYPKKSKFYYDNPTPLFHLLQSSYEEAVRRAENGFIFISEQ